MAYKPSHRPFLHAFEKMGVRREKILHVAQSLFHDIMPARELGIASVWVEPAKGQARLRRHLPGGRQTRA